MKRRTAMRLPLLALLVGAVAWALTRRGDFDIAAVATWVGSFGFRAPAGI